MNMNRFLLLLLLLIVQKLNAQKIYKEFDYELLEHNTFKRIIHRIEGKKIYRFTDNLILFTDSTYLRKIFGTNGMFISYEDIGTWQEEQDLIILNLKRFRIPESSLTWTEFIRIDSLNKRRHLLFPV
jgi:hypothetical protein